MRSGGYLALGSTFLVLGALLLLLLNYAITNGMIGGWSESADIISLVGLGSGLTGIASILIAIAKKDQQRRH